MTSSLPSKQPSRVGELLRRRLREVNRSRDELAEVLEVPGAYLDDLISGARRPPLPGRTDIYQKMTSFLRLGRNDLAACAHAERADAARGEAPAPEPGVRRLLLELCEPGTAQVLERRRVRQGSAELAGFIQRLLDVTQGAVRRLLDDQITLRLAAGARGTTYLELRLNVLEFLDATPDTLTTDDLTEFVQPRIARWDVNLETGVLWVALRGHEPRERGRGRAPGAGRPAARGQGMMD